MEISSTVILKVSDGYKTIHKQGKSQRGAEVWICKMMENDSFVYGDTGNGVFAVCSSLYAEYDSRTAEGGVNDA